MGLDISSPSGRLAQAAGLGTAEVLNHLYEVLASPVFRSSQRSCQFLRYVVESALAGEQDALKERVIGERIFGRAPDYDTGQDSIVRVKANEVRRRLAQYYDINPQAQLRIDLHSGSYVPVFHLGHVAAPPGVVPANGHAVTELAAPAVTPPAARRRRWWPVALALVLSCALAALGLMKYRAATTPFASFWQPFFLESHDLILCIPTPETYRIYGDGKDVLVQTFKPHPPSVDTPALPKQPLRHVQIVPESGMSLGLGDAHSMMLLYAFASGRGRAPLVRMGSDTTFTELRAGPGILIGGFTNRWTLDFLQGARFEFVSEGSTYGIRDKSTGEFVCRKPDAWLPRGNEDCGIVTRIIDAKTGHPLLVAAGLDHFGTYAAGELLTSEPLLEAALAKAPEGWQKKNLQMLFRVEVVRDNVGPPKVAAVHVW